MTVLFSLLENPLFNFTNVIFGIFVIYVICYCKQIRIILKTFRRDVRLVCTFAQIAITATILRYQKNQTVITMFKDQVKKNPKKVIFYFQDETWTVEDIDKYSNKIGYIFKEKGYKKGDVVALLSYNCIEYIGIWLGLSKIGVVCALINTNLRLQPLSHCINIAKVKGIIFSSDFVTALKEIRNEMPDNLEYFEYGQNVDRQHVNLNDLLSSAREDIDVVDKTIDLDDVFMFIYTSGTTGLPKAAVVVHRRGAYIALCLRVMINIKSDDIIYNPLPLYHTAGGLIGTLLPLTQGIPAVIRPKFSASQYIPDCIKYKCTIGQYIGEICRYVLATQPSSSDTQHQLRLLLGNGMKADTWKCIVDRFKIPIIKEVYGSTEGNVNMVNFDDKIGAVGCFPTFVPLSWLPLTLVRFDEETEQVVRDGNGFCIRCKPGEYGMSIGRISQRDPTRKFDGYVDQKETSKKIIKHVFKKEDAWFLSGDLLFMDEYRYLYFKDRTGDTYRWKGENVSTNEIENVISNKISGNMEFTVYGVKVGDLEGRAGMIGIVAKENEIDFKIFAQKIDKELPVYARPLFVRILPQLEITGTFKVIKTKLKHEGFNPDVIKDKLYFKHTTEGYIPLTREIYDQIINGSIKV